MVAKTERTTITLPIGMSEAAQKLGINISYESRIAVKKAMACKGKCPASMSLDGGCPGRDMGCKESYNEWCSCPQNPNKAII